MLKNGQTFTTKPTLHQEMFLDPPLSPYQEFSKIYKNWFVRGFLAGIQNPWKPLSFTLKYISCLERKFEIQKKSYSTHSNAQYPMQMSSTVRSESIDFHVANLYVSSKTLLGTRYPHIIFHLHFMFIEILTLFLILLYLDSIKY